MHEDIVGRRRAERERCNDAARRSKGPLLVGYINAANYYGAPIPRHCTLSVDAVHACVSSANKRRRIKGVVFHVFKGKLDIRKRIMNSSGLPRRHDVGSDGPILYIGGTCGHWSLFDEPR